MKTIKQIASELGVSKEAIRKQVPTLPPTCITTGANRSILINHDGEKILKDRVTTKSTNIGTNQVPTVDTLVGMLQKELEIKNEQIRELNARLAESNAALVAAQQSAKAAQALHAGTIQQQLIPETTPQEAPADPGDHRDRRGFFGWFNRKK